MMRLPWASVIVAGILLAQASIDSAPSQPMRIDLFDRNSNRSGYIVVDPKTGHIDRFDTKSNRIGTGTVNVSPGATPGSVDVRAQDQGGKSLHGSGRR